MKFEIGATCTSNLGDIYVWDWYILHPKIGAKLLTDFRVWQSTKFKGIPKELTDNAPDDAIKEGMIRLLDCLNQFKVIHYGKVMEDGYWSQREAGAFDYGSIASFSVIREFLWMIYEKSLENNGKFTITYYDIFNFTNDCRCQRDYLFNSGMIKRIDGGYKLYVSNDSYNIYPDIEYEFKSIEQIEEYYANN